MERMAPHSGEQEVVRDWRHWEFDFRITETVWLGLQVPHWGVWEVNLVIWVRMEDSRVAMEDFQSKPMKIACKRHGNWNGLESI